MPRPKSAQKRPGSLRAEIALLAATLAAAAATTTTTTAAATTAATTTWATAAATGTAGTGKACRRHRHLHEWILSQDTQQLGLGALEIEFGTTTIDFGLLHRLGKIEDLLQQLIPLFLHPGDLRVDRADLGGPLLEIASRNRRGIEVGLAVRC